MPTASRNFLILAGAGLLLAVIVAFLLNRPTHPQPPAFQPAANPYAQAIYANGVIESDQTSGENVNILPEVSGPVVAIYVREGDLVRAGQPLFAIDDSVQRGTTEQQGLQAQAALAALQELKAEPRRETLAVAVSQLDQAQANLKTLVDQRDKLQRSPARVRSSCLWATATAASPALAASIAESRLSRLIERGSSAAERCSLSR